MGGFIALLLMLFFAGLFFYERYVLKDRSGPMHRDDMTRGSAWMLVLLVFSFALMVVLEQVFDALPYDTFRKPGSLGYWGMTAVGVLGIWVVFKLTSLVVPHKEDDESKNRRDGNESP